jgi:hypothetical protein
VSEPLKLASCPQGQVQSFTSDQQLTTLAVLRKNSVQTKRRCNNVLLPSASSLCRRCLCIANAAFQQSGGTSSLRHHQPQTPFASGSRYPSETPAHPSVSDQRQRRLILNAVLSAQCITTEEVAHSGNRINISKSPHLGQFSNSPSTPINSTRFLNGDTCQWMSRFRDLTRDSLARVGNSTSPPAVAIIDGS